MIKYLLSFLLFLNISCISAMQYMLCPEYLPTAAKITQSVPVFVNYLKVYSAAHVIESATRYCIEPEQFHKQFGNFKTTMNGEGIKNPLIQKILYTPLYLSAAPLFKAFLSCNFMFKVVHGLLILSEFFGDRYRKREAFVTLAWNISAFVCTEILVSRFYS
jgi:hypothetical protein